MTGPENKGERRSEVRRFVPAQRILWTPQRATKTFTGWVSEIAESSISFVTPTRDQPAPGETIDLTLDAGGPSPQHRSVRVARTEPHDRFFSVVACRNETASQHADCLT